LCLSISLALILFAGLTSARAAEDTKGKKGKKADSAPPTVFYPDPPEKPRIQFLRTFSSDKDVKPKTSGFMKFVVGSEVVPEQIVKPYGATIISGQIMVCDIGRACVDVLDLEGKTFQRVGNGQQGPLKKPANIAVDKDGVRYVVDTGHKTVMAYSSDWSFVRSYGDPEKIDPSDIVVFDDDLYVCDIEHGQVAVLDKKTGSEKRRIGQKGSDEGELFMPSNIAVDADGNVYVSDTGNARVLKYDPRGRYAKQVGARGTSPGQFVRPKGIAVDRERQLYVVDAAFENVQIFDPDGNLLLFFGGPGNVPGGINLPTKVLVDYDNVGFFSDSVAPGYEVDYLVLVCSQFGSNMVNVYGFLKAK